MSAGDETHALADANARALEHELDWFERVLAARLGHHFEDARPPLDLAGLAMPDLSDDRSPYAALLRECGLGLEERLVLLLALAPSLRPAALDLLLARNPNLDRGFCEFGGRKGGSHGGFLPTLETAAFLIAGNNLAQRFRLRAMFDESHPFRRRDVFQLDRATAGDPPLAASLGVSSETLDFVTTGARHKPDFSSDFPARLITTQLGWDDLVLADEVLDEVLTVGADLNLTHPADPILTRGWKPTA